MSYRKKGFSLLETVVATTVLTIALLGVYSLASLGVSRASLAKNQNVAFFLAQEGEEYISNQRSSNSLQGRDWLTGFDACQNIEGCYIDAVNNSVALCPTGGCPKIKFDPILGYNHQSGTETVFQRIVKIETIDPAKEIKVKTEMRWLEHRQTKSFILENRLFNWAL